MGSASEIINKYISFFEDRHHTRIPNAPLVPENDPTTLFTSSGMQPLITYLLGEGHPQGNRLVNVQNAFRAVDMEEVGNNRHTTFFRMLGNWSLGDYFKKEQLPWFFEFLTKELGLDPKKLYVTVFGGNETIKKDTESIEIWKSLFSSVGIEARGGERIFTYGVDKNWWSRSGSPDKMPAGEPGGPDSEVFFDFGEELLLHKKSIYKDQKCHVNCDCGRYWEIGNSVFMEYFKDNTGVFKLLPKKNVDFGGGLERLVGAVENKADMFQTSLFLPTIKTIEKQTGKEYSKNMSSMQIIADHFGGSIFMAANGIQPANKEQGYIMRRLIRRSLDHFKRLDGKNIAPIIETIVEQYKDTDPVLVDKFEYIENTILEEEGKYSKTRAEAARFIEKELAKFPLEGDEIMGEVRRVSSALAFKALATYGLSPTQLESLGYQFDKQALVEKIKEHQKISRAGAEKKFKGGLADHSEQTIKGHTATHLLHQALRDVLGSSVHQTGSNITTERVRFDYSYDKKLTDEEKEKVEKIVREKIKIALPVHFEILSLDQAKQAGAIGLFDEKYGEKVKIYFIGGDSKDPKKAYSKEFCGGPHVTNTSDIKSFTITKEESLGKGKRRIYAIVE